MKIRDKKKISELFIITAKQYLINNGIVLQRLDDSNIIKTVTELLSLFLSSEELYLLYDNLIKE